MTYRKIAIYALTFWIIQGICSPGFGQTPDVLEPVTVTAEKDREAYDAPYRVPESSRAATWEMDQDEIEEQHPETLYDILTGSPGMSVSFQGRKSMNFTSGRGGGRYAIILNGNYVPWTQAGRILADLPTSAIASVRVVRDSTVLTLGPMIEPGSQASVAQGYIIITTRKPTDTQTRIKGEYGTHDRYTVFLNHGHNTGDWYYDISGNILHDNGEEDWNNASESASLLLSAGLDRPDLSVDFTAYGDWAEREIQRSTDISKTHDSKWAYDPLETLMVSARVSRAWSPNQTTAVGIYSGTVNTDLHIKSYTKSTSKVYDQEDRIFQADVRHSLKTGSAAWTFGGQAIFWETPTGQFYYETMPREEEMYSLYAQTDWSATDSLSLDAGIRGDRKHISKGVDRYAPMEATTYLIEDKWTTPTVCAAAGARYRLTDIWAVSARYAYSYNDTDTFINTVDNTDLAAEERHKYEAALSTTWCRALSCDLTLFCYDLKNTKVSVDSTTIGDDTVNIYDNFDIVQHGAEIRFRGSFDAAPVSYDASWSWQTADDSESRKELPEHQASVRVSYTPEPYQFQVTANYADTWQNNFFASDSAWHDVGGYTRIDANIGRSFIWKACTFKALLFGRNITDESYQTRLGWDNMGRTVGVSLEMDI